MKLKLWDCKVLVDKDCALVILGVYYHNRLGCLATNAACTLCTHIKSVNESVDPSIQENG